MIFQYPTLAKPSDPQRLRRILISSEYQNILETQNFSKLQSFRADDTLMIAEELFAISDIENDAASAPLIQKLRKTISDSIQILKHPDILSEDVRPLLQQLDQEQTQLDTASQTITTAQLYQQLVTWQILFSELYTKDMTLWNLWVEQWPLAQTWPDDQRQTSKPIPKETQSTSKKKPSSQKLPTVQNNVGGFELTFILMPLIMFLFACVCLLVSRVGTTHQRELLREIRNADTQEEFVSLQEYKAEIEENQYYLSVYEKSRDDYIAQLEVMAEGDMDHDPQKLHEELTNALLIFPEHTETLKTLSDSVLVQHLSNLIGKSETYTDNHQFSELYPQIIRTSKLLYSCPDWLTAWNQEASTKYIDYTVAQSIRHTFASEYMQAHQLLTEALAILPEYEEQLSSAMAENRDQHCTVTFANARIRAQEGNNPRQDTSFDELLALYPEITDAINACREECLNIYFSSSIQDASSYAKDGNFASAQDKLSGLEQQFPLRTEEIDAARRDCLNSAIDANISAASKVSDETEALRVVNTISELMSYAPDHTGLQDAHNVAYERFIEFVLDESAAYIYTHEYTRSLDHVEWALGYFPQDPTLLAEQAYLQSAAITYYLESTIESLLAYDYISAEDTLSHGIQRFPNDPSLKNFRALMVQFQPVPVQELMVLSDEFTPANGVEFDGSMYIFDDSSQSVAMECYLKKEYKILTASYGPHRQLDGDNHVKLNIWADNAEVLNCGWLSGSDTSTSCVVPVYDADILKIEVLNLAPDKGFSIDGALVLENILLWKLDPNDTDFSDFIP